MHLGLIHYLIINKDFEQGVETQHKEAEVRLQNAAVPYIIIFHVFVRKYINSNKNIR